MTDEVKTTPEAQQEETPQVSEQQEPVVENQTTPEEATEQPTESVEEQQQTPKPTRAERRLQQLLSKNKPHENAMYDLVDQLPEIQPSEDGTLTQEQLQQLISREAMKVVKMTEEQKQYVNQVQSFTAEVEEVGDQIDQDFKDNPKMAEKINNLLTRTLRAANVRTDAYGREVVVPVLSAKEAYLELKDALNISTTSGKAQATAQMAQQIAEGAITPSSRQPSEENMADLTAAEIFKNPRAVREALEKKLSRA